MSAQISPALLLLVVGASGCALDAPPPQLEPLRVEALSPVAQGDEGFATTGLLSVVGAGRDYGLRVEGDAPLDLALHLPGESDLSTLDGRTVTVELTATGRGAWDRGVAIYDSAGLVFLAQSSWDDRLGAVWFGEDLVGWGEALYGERDSGRTLTYTAAVFETDRGEVSLLPGEAEALTLRGAAWRVVVNAAYQVDDDGLFDVACPDSGDLISFEMLRPEGSIQDGPALLEAESGRELTSTCQ